jgi:hypothetical protein
LPRPSLYREGFFIVNCGQMKKAFFTVVLSAGILSSFAQVKCNINNAYAYFTVTMPGAQMVDEKGNPVPPVPVVERFIYLEYTGTKKPEIQAVYYNNTSVPVTVTKVEGNAVFVGEKPEYKKKITIRAKKGSTFYKLELQPPNDKPWEAIACKNIIIKLNWAGKICSYKVLPGESQLYSPPMY